MSTRRKAALLDRRGVANELNVVGRDPTIVDDCAAFCRRSVTDDALTLALNVIEEANQALARRFAVAAETLVGFLPIQL